MKTFKDLVFNKHPYGEGEYAKLTFSNNYGVSIICGSKYYSNGVDTYELAVLYGDDITYNTGITSDVMGYQTCGQITDIMKQVQELKDT